MKRAHKKLADQLDGIEPLRGADLVRERLRLLDYRARLVAVAPDDLAALLGELDDLRRSTRGPAKLTKAELARIRGRDDGQEVRMPGRKSMLVRIRPDVHAAVEEYAEARGWSYNRAVNEILAKEVLA